MRKKIEIIEKEIREAIEKKQPENVQAYALSTALLKLEELANERGTVDFLDISMHEMGAFYAMGLFRHLDKENRDPQTSMKE